MVGKELEVARSSPYLCVNTFNCVEEVQNHQTSICKVSTGGGATYAALIIDRLELVGATVGLMFVDHLIMFVSKKKSQHVTHLRPPPPFAAVTHR
ncbi:hypothetical protein HanRHA438_Chr07g0290371 [Helianthus annuus]|nr:hypothetical protein HanRHA438_Chr07g0290371 [Helianthus annuus]